MSVSFGGLASGIDTQSIISQLVSIERNSVRTLETRRAQAEQSQSAFNALSSRLETLRTAVQSMQDISTFGRLSVGSSDESILTATSSGNATPGVFSVEVQSVANAQKTMSEAFADTTQTGLFGEGTLTIGVGTDDTVDITVDASTTLATLKDDINDSSADVFASIVNTTEGFRLVIAGKSTGASKSISFTEGGTLGLGLNTPANTFQTASDASLVIDGVLNVSSESNSISDAIEGVTLDLRRANVGETVDITIERDTDGQAESIQEFIDGYNDVVSFIDSQTRTANIGERGPLLNNPTMLGIKRTLQRTLQSTIATGSDYTSAINIGIETNSSGRLELDKDTLNRALADDFDGALSIFTFDDTGLADLFESSIETMIDVDGLIPKQNSNLSSRVRDLNSQIDRQNERVDRYEERLRAQFLAMEQAISSLNTQSASLQSALVF
ncbi:MAG: flagellar filament capping protein FliD [Myxococcota bacterium]